jgi:hypothetical protein
MRTSAFFPYERLWVIKDGLQCCGERAMNMSQQGKTVRRNEEPTDGGGREEDDLCTYIYGASFLASWIAHRGMDYSSLAAPLTKMD